MNLTLKRRYKDGRRPATAPRSMCLLLGYDVFVDGEKIGGIVLKPDERRVSFTPMNGGPSIEADRLKALKSAIAASIKVTPFKFELGELVEMLAGTRGFVRLRERQGGTWCYWLDLADWPRRRSQWLGPVVEGMLTAVRSNRRHSG